jgi:Flp pilus assembly pilin Flp
MRSVCRRFIQDESAQATTEYMLMMAVALAITVALIKNFLKPTFERLRVALANQVEKTLFSGDMHRLNIGGH